MTPDYLTPKEVADRLRLPTTSTLANWRNLRKGPPFRKFGRHVLYPIDLLTKWEADQTVETK